jgi:hypothetical protein
MCHIIYYTLAFSAWKDYSRPGEMATTLEGKHHIINMVIGGRIQYLTRVQGMPKEIEETLIRLPLGRKKGESCPWSYVAGHCWRQKQILDILSRNEAIDLWNLQSYLVQGPERALWCDFIDYIFIKFVEVSYLNIQPGQVSNAFLQDIHVPISSQTPLPDPNRMVLPARKYLLHFHGSVN